MLTARDFPGESFPVHARTGAAQGARPARVASGSLGATPALYALLSGPGWVGYNGRGLRGPAPITASIRFCSLSASSGGSVQSMQLNWRMSK